MDKPHFILDKKRLLETYNSLAEKGDMIAYSFKTNPLVGQVLEESTPCRLSVHTALSLKEIKDKSRVIFFAQAWDEMEIGKLIDLGISWFVIDNERDLEVLLGALGKQEQQVTLFLRMKLKEYTIHTGKHFVFGLGAKRVNELICQVQSNPRIAALGIHFHRKTQNLGEWGIKAELEQSLAPETLKAIRYLDIGGGLPVPYKNSRIENYGFIFSQISELRGWLHQDDVDLIIEPGRYLAAPCIELHTTIKNVYENNIIIDASVYNAAMDTFIANVKLKVKGELPEGKGAPFTIKGVTPDSTDIFRYRVFLAEPKVGDKMIFENAGAYNFSANFCGLEKLPTRIKE
ncbi:decarboxylase [Candidatus Woesearchaeota archaeon]|nr:decarboxylase [Candidatus Woesearchaeota archaeon]HIH39093.1 decarboxylase [Candidatus Woesearchaeota archaeon]HIH49373.1 decarboxylase [Candidatus Woesearchaeota archaeon]HIJ04404.1 decarboxylase [Candidatus Woesearchaeota archaeon]